ncbi:hypothetical protein [Thermococcus sp. JCM 11816]|uniref:hypothetical protein n=1 Tax=Thermococcus sp. (strain JCM 11816 / KS-1) TaxID=1295125 RepID=UPI0006D03F08
MFGLEDLPFPVKLLIAILADLIDALNLIPGVGDLIETPINAFVAYVLTDNILAATANSIDGLIPAPFDIFPTATLVVIADHMGWI